ncbi:hypothetical protein [Caballeronia sp. BR00000012568055]|uniref:hypothetical protein n=1 Tax=Caballeronia sp. BR00000012568055 TaxID=2918761 RepID=UPI0023F6CB76|nr:hypothetical protein [Caballeronia sp. BR00000012568055]
MEQFCVAADLIVRESERSFFDKKQFRILRFNHSGFDILHQKLDKAFSNTELVDACEQAGIASDDAHAFWQKCLDNGVIVPA